MTSVNICIGHDDDAPVAKLGVIKVFTDTALQSLNQRANFFKTQHLVEARSLHIQELSAQWQNRLANVIAAALGASTCAVTFHDEQFSLLHVA